MPCDIVARVAPMEFQASAELEVELARRLAEKPPLAVQGTVKAVWDSFHMTAAGAREIPLHYPQLGNPSSTVDFTPGARPPFELR